ncbi:hypothetical protein BVC80_9049g32 [Macleaya cordata]|uniref:Uncharacterized protein n=1 Tax=Macleaya cordata TaxID=56857 RepID=A0A200R2E8_MACCD|nr:hypothetical protein BVC80_9049g32 [Macleaya cordata]
MHEQSILTHTPVSNFPECNNAVETARLKVNNGILMDDKNEIMFNPRIRNLERGKNLLPTEEQHGDGFGKVPGLHDLLDVDSINGVENKTGYSTNPFIIPFYDILSRKEKELYTEEQNRDGFRNLPDLHYLVDVEDSINGVENKTGDSTNPFITPCDDKLSRIETELYTEEQNGDGFRKLPGLDDLVGFEDSIQGTENKTGDSTNPFIVPPCDDLSQKETELYTDKSVTECELPELIVCFKEGAYNVIKDICIDEGLPSFNKILIEKGEVPDKELFACLNSDMDVNNEITKGMVCTTAPVSDGIDPSIDCQYETDGAIKCWFEKGEGNYGVRDETPNMVSDEKVKLENEFLVQDCNNYSPHEPCNIDGGGGQRQSDQVLHFDARDETLNIVSDEKVKLGNESVVEDCSNNSPHEPCNINGSGGQQQSDQDTCEVGQSTNSLAPSVAEEESNNCNQACELPSNSEVESGTITLDIDSLPPPTTSGREEEDNPQKTDFQQTLQTVNRLGHEEDLQDSKTASSRSFFIQHGHGESSFSSVGPHSGPIAYSGPIPYSGSISLRSDSSTTSTRSFAFPVLHSEWNSSPVKMVSLVQDA